MRTFDAVVKCHYVSRLEVSLCEESLAGHRRRQRRLSHLHPRPLVLVAQHRLGRHYPVQRIVSLDFSTPKNQPNNLSGFGQNFAISDEVILQNPSIIFERFISVPSGGLASGYGSALLLGGEDGEGESNVGNDKVDDVAGESADEAPPAEGARDGRQQVGEDVDALVAMNLGFALLCLGMSGMNQDWWISSSLDSSNSSQSCLMVCKIPDSSTGPTKKAPPQSCFHTSPTTEPFS